MAKAQIIRKKLPSFSSVHGCCACLPTTFEAEVKSFQSHSLSRHVRNTFYCPFLLPTHDWINSITLENTYSGHEDAVDAGGVGRPVVGRRRDKGICTYPIISFIWRRFENNSPSHLSLSGHIIHKWSLQNINSVSIKGGWISTHECWIYQIIILEGTLVASKYFPVRSNQKQTAEY